MYAPIYAEPATRRMAVCASRARGRGALLLTLLLAVGPLLCTLGTAALGAAQTDQGEREQEAAARFERGVELYGEGSLDAALVQFERAYELIPNYRVLYNLAQIQAERHEYVAALSLYERYLEQGGEQIAAARRTESLAQIEILRERVGTLWVESDVAGAKLFVDDDLVGELPLSSPVAIDAGVRHVRLEKPGFAPVFRQLKVAGGDRPRLRLSLARLDVGATPGSAASGAAADAPAVRDYRPLWISTTATVVLGAAAVTMGVLARGANQDLERALNTFPFDPQEVQESRSQVKAFAALTDALAVVSVISLGLSVYFLVVPPRAPAVGRDSSLARGRTARFDVAASLRWRTEQPASTRASLRLSAHATGLGLVGSF
jgi:tetratricopeptide (TPR) repeat protein